MFCPHKETAFGINGKSPQQWDVLRFHRSWKKMSLLGCPTKSNKLQLKIKQSCHWGNSFCSTTDPSHVFDLRQDLVFIPKCQSTENRSHFLHIFMLCKQMETMAALCLAIFPLSESQNSFKFTSESSVFGGIETNDL